MTLSSVGPQVKLVAALVLLVAFAAIPRTMVQLQVLVGAVPLIALLLERPVPSFVMKRLAFLVPLLPALVATTLLAEPSQGATVSIAGVDVVDEALWASWGILAKAIFGVVVASLLAATTTRTELLAGLAALRCPNVMIAIAAAMVRYIEVVSEDFARSRRAMAVRGYEPGWFWQWRPLATSAGAMFVRTYERAERVHLAMLSRSFAGNWPIDAPRAPVRQWLAVLSVPTAALMAVMATRW